MDLVALNLQRGRDHGLAPYVKWRQLCGLRSVKSWKSYASVVASPEVRFYILLSDLYWPTKIDSAIHVSNNIFILF